MSDSEDYSDSDRSSEYSDYSDDSDSSDDDEDEDEDEDEDSYDSDDYSDSESDSDEDSADDSDDDEDSDDDSDDESSAGDDSSDEEASTGPEENQNGKSESQPNAQEAAQRIQRAFRNYRSRKDALLDFDPNDYRFSREELIERAVRVLLAPDIQPRTPSLTGLPFKPLQWKPPRWHSLVQDTSHTFDYSGDRFSPNSVPSHGVDGKIATEELRIYDPNYRYRDRYNVDIIQPLSQTNDLNMINTRLPPPPAGNTATGATNYSGIVINNPYSTSVDSMGTTHHYNPQWAMQHQPSVQSQGRLESKSVYVGRTTLPDLPSVTPLSTMYPTPSTRGPAFGSKQ